MIDVGAIDRSATSGGGPLRDASPAVKLWALALVVGAALVNWNVLVLGSVFLSLVAALLWGRLRPGLALGLAAYPSIFAVVFAFASAPSMSVAAAIVGKAVTAALAAALVVLSTPYPQVFAHVQRVTPGIVGDALLMTYRSAFILLEKFASLMQATRLRSGTQGRGSLRSIKSTAAALGGLLLYALDLAQRDYDIMRVRGYEGRLRVSPQPGRNRRADIVVLSISAVLLATSVVFRLESVALNPYSWIVPLPALALVGAAAITSRRNLP